MFPLCPQVGSEQREVRAAVDFAMMQQAPCFIGNVFSSFSWSIRLVRMLVLLKINPSFLRVAGPLCHRYVCSPFIWPIRLVRRARFEKEFSARLRDFVVRIGSSPGRGGEEGVQLQPRTSPPQHTQFETPQKPHPSARTQPT